MTTITSDASWDFSPFAAGALGHRVALLVKGVRDQPDDEEPQHGADEQGNQEAPSRAERVVPGITTGRSHSLSGVPLRLSLGAH
jgi:hypothetical protein